MCDPKLTPFNVNHHVRVKLTSSGHKAYRAFIERLRLGAYDYTVKEDADGWSRWQMWHLMQVFGPAISMGFDPPFETEIQLEGA